MPQDDTRQPPEVFSRKDITIFDSTPAPEQKNEHGKEATGQPTHEPRYPGPGGDSVISQNQHRQHTASSTPTPEPSRHEIPSGERALNWTNRETGGGYASHSFRNANNRDGRSR